MSPQASNGQEYGQKTDCWSMGVVLVEMLTLEASTINPMDFQPLKPTEIGSSDNPDALRKCICSKMLVKEENERATVEQIIDDEAFKNHFPAVEAKAKAWESNEA